MRENFPTLRCALTLGVSFGSPSPFKSEFCLEFTFPFLDSASFFQYPIPLAYIPILVQAHPRSATVVSPDIAHLPLSFLVRRTLS